MSYHLGIKRKIKQGYDRLQQREIGTILNRAGFVRIISLSFSICQVINAKMINL